MSATLNGHDIGSNLKLGGIEHGGPQRDEFNNFKKFMFAIPKQSLEWLSRGGHNNVDLTVRCGGSECFVVLKNSMLTICS